MEYDSYRHSCLLGRLGEPRAYVLNTASLESVKTYTQILVIPVLKILLSLGNLQMM